MAGLWKRGPAISPWYRLISLTAFAGYGALACFLLKKKKLMIFFLAALTLSLIWLAFTFLPGNEKAACPGWGRPPCAFAQNSIHYVEGIDIVSYI